MLKPATPLTIALFISFVLLLLSTLSTPVIKSIPLATFQGVNFGVFGYCTPNSGCTSIRVGYTTNGVFGSSDNGDFQLPAGARHSLSSLLIVHPIATFLNLIALGLAGAAHLHSPSHSARYLLGLLILLLPTLLVTLLAFLVDILLFVPHLQWGGWIVLGSVISIAVAGVFTCAMRRTLVSRKARKKRIAENAEMSGENFYARQATEAKLPPTATFSSPTETKAPMVNGAPGADNLPSFTTYNSGMRTEDDRQPLTSQVGANNISPVTRDNGSERYYGGPPSRSNSQPRPPYSGPKDQFGNPLPQRSASGDVPPMPVRGNSRGPGPYRDPMMPPPNSMPPPAGMPPPRGGYGQRGRGGYPSRGGYPPRGGYGPGPRGPPPQGYNGRGGYSARGRGGFNPAMGMAAGAVGGAMIAGNMRSGQPPPPGYGPQSNEYSPEERENPISPSVYSQADAHGAYGARSQSPGRQYGSRGQSPSDVVRAESPPPQMPPLPGSLPVEAPANEYVPARAAWQQPAVTPSGPPGQGVVAYSEPQQRPRVNSGGSDVYYEDVDPRFAAPEPMAPLHPQPEVMPRILTPGGRNYDDPSAPIPQQANAIGNGSYEDLPGARSPAESETSNFTSVSQRGVNPNWRPGYGPPDNFNSFGPAGRPPKQAHMRRDVLLAGNPDFELPGMAPSRRGARGGMRGGVGGGMARGPGPMAPPMSASAVGGGDGPYPRGPPPSMGMGNDVREI